MKDKIAKVLKHCTHTDYVGEEEEPYEAIADYEAIDELAELFEKEKEKYAQERVREEIKKIRRFVGFARTIREAIEGGHSEYILDIVKSQLDYLLNPKKYDENS